jgi:hypothetical protein
LVTKQALDLAQAWLGSTGQDNTDLQFTDNPVVDPFAIVTDHHTSNITKSTHLDQAPKNITYQKQQSTAAVLPQTEMAVSKGITLTLGSKRPLITTDDSVPPASQTATSSTQGRDLTPATISDPSMAQSVDELKLPPHLNLLYMSQDYVNWNVSKHYNKKHTNQHMFHGVQEPKDPCQL